MRKHLLSTVAILVMIFLALGSTDTDPSNSPPDQSAPQIPNSPHEYSDPLALPTLELESSDSEVDRVLAERTAKYEERLAAWNSANETRAEAETERNELQKQIDQVDRDRPKPPKFYERKWNTSDEKYQTNAVLVTTDNKTVKLQKPDGTSVTVSKDKLNLEGRVYIAIAFKELSTYREILEAWESRRQDLTDKRAALSDRIASADRPKPDAPTRQEVANELAAEAENRKEQERLARQEAARNAARNAAEAAARKAEEEYDQNGLVLMRKTVSATGGDFGVRITGIVENRRSRKLSYAQITFNLYDDSGAQVGSALANINGLEAGGKWRFEATSFGTRFSTYKFDDLSGFYCTTSGEQTGEPELDRMSVFQRRFLRLTFSVCRRQSCWSTIQVNSVVLSLPDVY